MQSGSVEKRLVPDADSSPIRHTGLGHSSPQNELRAIWKGLLWEDILGLRRLGLQSCCPPLAV